MSDFTISSPTLEAAAMTNQASGAEIAGSSLMAGSSTLNTSEPLAQSDIAGQVVSPTSEYMGNGTNLSAVGTEHEVQNMVNNSVFEMGTGSIANLLV